MEHEMNIRVLSLSYCLLINMRLMFNLCLPDD